MDKIKDALATGEKLTVHKLYELLPKTPFKEVWEPESEDSEEEETDPEIIEHLSQLQFLPSKLAEHPDSIALTLVLAGSDIENLSAVLQLTTTSRSSSPCRSILGPPQCSHGCLHRRRAGSLTASTPSASTTSPDVAHQPPEAS